MTKYQVVPVGAVIQSSQYGLSLPAVTEGTLPIVGMKDIRAGRVVIDPNAKVNLSADNAADYLLEDGDILINRTNSPDLVGKAGIFRGSDKAVFASYLVRLHLDSRLVAPDYLIQVLTSDPGQQAIRALATRAVGQANLNPTTFKKHFKIPLPEIEVQQGIARLLRTWDAAIEKTEQLIVARDDQHRALSRALLFGVKRLEPGTGAEARQLYSFSVPGDWEIVAIGEIASELSTTGKSFVGLPVLSCTKHDGLVESLSYFKRQVFSRDTVRYKLVLRGQFAYATNHLEEGSIGHLDFMDRGLVSPMYTVFKATSNKVDDKYLYRLLKTETMRRLFAAWTNSSVDRRGGLRWPEFARLRIPLPPMSEQRAISAVLEDSGKETALLRSQLEALRSQKRGLMKRLLTGEWRAPAAAGRGGKGVD